MTINFTLPPRKRFLLFICILLLCLIVGGVLISLLMGISDSTSALRISTVLQDVIIFILPAVLTACIITRQPADFLLVKRQLDFKSLLIIFLTIIVAIPAMESLISWNNDIQLPASMSHIEEWMRQSELNASKSVKALVGGDTIGSLVMAILIIGILAGFSEEILFRGTIQRLLQTSGINIHVAIWSTAFIFSAIHLQFYGFIPRLLLGAYFGYLVYWSGSLWPAIAAHILNNTMAVIGLWQGDSSTSQIFSSPSVIYIVISVVLTVMAITTYKRIQPQN